MRDMIKSKPKQDAIYAEGGPLNPEELQGGLNAGIVN